VGCVAATIDAPSAPAQRLLDELTLHFGQRDSVAARLLQTRRVVEQQRVADGVDHRPLDNVLELADVAWPRALLQVGKHRGRNVRELAIERALAAIDEI